MTFLTLGVLRDIAVSGFAIADASTLVGAQDALTIDVVDVELAEESDVVDE